MLLNKCKWNELNTQQNHSLNKIWNLAIPWRANTLKQNNSKWLELSLSFFHIMKIWNIGGHLQLVSCLYVNWSPNESALKKVAKKLIFSAWDLLPFSEKRQKPPNFEQVPLPNHWTYNVLWGIFGKTISRSFIWYPRKWCMSNGLAVNKSWK